MSSFAGLLQSISESEITRVNQENGFTRWSYFADEVTGVVGIIGANDHSLAMYYVSRDNTLKLGPLGVMQLHAVSYRPDAEKLVIVSAGQYLDLFVLNDLRMVGENGMEPNFDFSVAKQWQDFLASHNVRTTEAPGPAAATSGGTNASTAEPWISRRQIVIVVVVVIIVFAAVTMIEQPWNAGLAN